MACLGLFFSLPACSAYSADQTTQSHMSERPHFEYSTKEIIIQSNGHELYGIAYIPKADNGTSPLVIYSHGLGGSYRSGLQYAEALAARGIAAYTFDFYGGSSGSRQWRRYYRDVGYD